MKPKKLKMARQFKECSRCDGSHTDWWKSTPPPGCDERVKRGWERR